MTRMHIIHHDWEPILSGPQAGECIFCLYPESHHHALSCPCDYHVINSGAARANRDAAARKEVRL